MEQFIPLISEVGFPIVVTLYLLYRIEASWIWWYSRFNAFQSVLMEMINR